MSIWGTVEGNTSDPLYIGATGETKLSSGDIGVSGTITKIHIYGFASGVGTNPYEIAIYQGGTSTDPTGAAKIGSTGSVDGDGNASPHRISINVSIPFSAGQLWVAFARTTESIYVYGTEANAGDFDVCGSGSTRTRTVSAGGVGSMPSTWNLGAGSDERNEALNIYLEYAEGVGPSVAISAVSDTTLQHGQTDVTITGTGFGASQGSGKVYLSPTDAIADSGKVEQTVTAWSDTSITITVAKGALAFGAAYLFVQENGGASNAAGYAVSLITRGPQRSMLLGLG